MTAYTQALRSYITTESVVLDMGAGPGIFALLACQLGARQVYAVEPDEVVHIARRLAETNGYGERIECLQARSEQIRLAEPADIIISDLRGTLPFYLDHIPAIMDARERHLRPGGRLLPQQDTVWAALLSSAEIYERIAHPWLGNEFDLDLSPVWQNAQRNISSISLKDSDLLTQAQAWTVLDYRSIASADANGSLSWTIEQQAYSHGLALWFEAEIAPGIRFSSRDSSIYGVSFLPWPQAVLLQTQDRVHIDLQAKHLSHGYVWSWQVQVYRAGADQPFIQFKQSSAFSQVLSPRQLRSFHSDAVPNLNTEGEILRCALSLFDGQQSVQAISERLAEGFPENFSDTESALDKVQELIKRYA